ncbi:hypothetical protein BJV77DRAFT_968414 [Russula vinacea]|nr:hypothetical protein BJV77DRAFT_968414 [Russula vinacea]
MYTFNTRTYAFNTCIYSFNTHAYVFNTHTYTLDTATLAPRTRSFNTRAYTLDNSNTHAQARCLTSSGLDVGKHMDGSSCRGRVADAAHGGADAACRGSGGLTLGGTSYCSITATLGALERAFKFEYLRRVPSDWAIWCHSTIYTQYGAIFGVQ